MNELMGHGPDGVRRVLGIPVDIRGLTEPRARLRAYEPENPSLLVPRAFGVGWDLNIGAIAAKLGLIRPDDSLQDLEEHIPARASALLALAPLGGAAVVAALGAWATLSALRSRGTAAPQGPEVAATAQVLGLQTMSAALIVASRRAAERPERCSLLALGGMAAFPAVSTAVLVGTVRTALSNLDRELKWEGRSD